MPQYGEVLFNITGAAIATLNANNTYGTPAQIDLIGDFNFDFEADTDEIKSAGLIAEALAIGTKATGTLRQASLDFLSMQILTGFSSSSSGTTPNRAYTMDALVGGDGYPYFGLIAAFASTFGANVLVGFPKCKIDKQPGWTVEQNKFRIGECGMMMIPRDVTNRRLVRIRRHETAVALPGDATAFGAFFTGF